MSKLTERLANKIERDLGVAELAAYKALPWYKKIFG